MKKNRLKITILLALTTILIFNFSQNIIKSTKEKPDVKKLTISKNIKPSNLLKISQVPEEIKKTLGVKPSGNLRVLETETKKIVVNNRIWIKTDRKTLNSLEKVLTVKRAGQFNYIEYDFKDFDSVISLLKQNKVKYSFSEVKKSPRPL